MDQSYRFTRTSKGYKQITPCHEADVFPSYTYIRQIFINISMHIPDRQTQQR